MTDRVEKTADRLGNTAEKTANAAIQRVRDVRERAESGLDQQRAQVADRIRRLGGVLRAGSETLSTDDPFAQNLLTTAGDTVERVAEYIGNATPSDLANDVTSFARRRPGVFFGSAFLVGLALGRFAKSTTRAVASGGGESSESYGEEDYSTEADYSGSYAAEQSTLRERASGSAFGTTTAAGAQGATLPYAGTATTGTVGSGSAYGTTSGATSPSGTSYGGSTQSTTSTSGVTPSSTSGTSTSGTSTSGTGTTGSTGASSASTTGTTGTTPTTSSTSTPKATAASKTPSTASSTSTTGTSTSNAASTSAKETDRGQGTKS